MTYIQGRSQKYKVIKVLRKLNKINISITKLLGSQQEWENTKVNVNKGKHIIHNKKHVRVTSIMGNP